MARKEFNVWHRLEPWANAVHGLERMKKNYGLATLSNGNVSLLVEMAKNAGLPWVGNIHFHCNRQVKTRTLKKRRVRHPHLASTINLGATRQLLQAITESTTFPTRAHHLGCGE